ncbi:unnamed protein product, partial [Mesorhabditis spiculigera]
MAEPKVALQISPPQELVFQGPFTDVVTSPLRLMNRGTQPICFKVKTTAPKQYCVRPNSGIVAPGHTFEVSVMLQPTGNEASVEASRHKFMVQYCYAPHENVDLEGLWKTINPADLSYSKLRVVFAGLSNANTTLGTQEETPASIKYIQNSTTKSVHHTPPGIQTSSHVTNLRSGNDDEFARMQQKAQKAENELTAVRKDLDDIMKKYTKLQHDRLHGQAEVGFPTLQAILITVAGLLIGLILGKLM